MAEPLETFVQKLEESGILAGKTLADFIRPDAAPKDAEELAAELIRRKKLTKFQADLISQGKGKSLVLGNYVLLEKIGQGGMGAVYKAEHRRMDRTVAIKLLPPAMTHDKSAIARFEREVKAAAKLFHPNIVPALDADEADGVHFLVMECVNGDDLAALVKKNGPFTVVRAVNFILQAARGLEFAHKKGVIHRDIKPSNLLLDAGGTVKILDMGLARIEGDTSVGQAELTGTGTVMGTVDYMAPEQALCTKTADARADIYSLGCSLYYLLSGKAVYAGDTMMSKLLAHREHSIPSLQDVQSNVPKQVEAVFKQMVAKKAEDRYQTMSEVVHALETLGIGDTAGRASGEAATVLELSPEEKKKLGAAAVKRTSESKTEVLTVEKTKHVLLKVAGGVFATIIAPILVAYLMKYLDKVESPKSQAASAGPITSGTSVTAAVTSTAASGGQAPPGGQATLGTPESAGTNPLTAAEVSKPWEAPAFQQWMKDVQALPAEQQIEAVSKKLMELNPGFDGKLTGFEGEPKIENGVVKEIGVISDNVSDISPVGAFVGLQRLRCDGLSNENCKFSDLGPLKGMKLTGLVCKETKVADLSPLRGMPLDLLVFAGTRVTDLSPLRGMSIRVLIFPQTHVSELSPLAGMPLVYLSFFYTPVANLAPLEGMPLTRLICHNTNVSDLSPLKGMSLERLEIEATTVSDLQPIEGIPLAEALHIDGTNVSDLSPLAGSKLVHVRFTPNRIKRGIEVLRKLETIKEFGTDHLNVMPANEFWKKYDAGEFTWNTPEFQHWMMDVAVMPAEKQLEAVSRKLVELNPGFDGKLTGFEGKGSPRIENGIVIELGFASDNVVDISPVRAFAELQKLDCSAIPDSGCQFSDLSPLKGLKMKHLACKNTRISDLTPLSGMPLESVNFYYTLVRDVSPLTGSPLKEFMVSATPVADLTPLKGMSLISVVCNYTQISDLSPLKGQPLEFLNCEHCNVAELAPLQGMPLRIVVLADTKVSDLTPLKGMKMTWLVIRNTPVADLSVLEGMPLTYLEIGGTKVSDLTPLAGMKLNQVTIDPSKIKRGINILRQSESIKEIGKSFDKLMPSVDFWKKYDAGEFGDPTPQPQ